jgi:microcystin-dependent protein
MGGTDAGNLSVSNTLGAKGGEEKHPLIVSEMPSHTHLQNAHTHTQNAHTHTQDAHTHTQNSHSHSAGSYDGLYGINNAGVTDGGGGNAYQGLYAGGSPNARIITNGATATNQNATATNQNTTATNQNTTATNQNTGGDVSHNNMQPYILTNYIIKT